jgi:hypothetical protein
VTQQGTRPDQRAAATTIQELLATVLLVAAAVGTSWSSYQATRWNGEQALAASKTNATRIEAARAASRADAETEVDVATFIAWADADRRGEDDVADFYLDRFRPEFATAFDAWLATDPLTTRTAPPTPFRMPSYTVASREEAERLDAAAGVGAETVARNIQRASNYVLTVVLYAVVLFFAGMSIKLAGRRLRWVMIGTAYAVMAATIGWLATFPISLEI